MASAKPTLINLRTNREVTSTGSLPDVVTQVQSVAWTHRQPALAGSATTAFVGTNPARYTVTLHFQKVFPTPGDVRVDVEPLLALSKQGSQGADPPPALFVWGTINAPVLVDDLAIEYLHFESSGFPTSARVQLLLTEIRDPKTLNKTTSPAGIAAGGRVAMPKAAKIGLAADLMRAKREITAAVAKAKREVDRIEEQVDELLEPLFDEADRAFQQLVKLSGKAVRLIDRACQEILALVDKLTEEVVRSSERLLLPLLREAHGAITTAAEEGPSLANRIEKLSHDLNDAQAAVDEAVAELGSKWQDDPKLVLARGWCDRIRGELAKLSRHIEQCQQESALLRRLIGEDASERVLRKAKQLVQNGYESIQEINDADKSIKKFIEKVKGIDNNLAVKAYDKLKKWEEMVSRVADTLKEFASQIKKTEEQWKKSIRDAQEKLDEIKRIVEGEQTNLQTSWKALQDAVDRIGKERAQVDKKVRLRIVQWRQRIDLVRGQCNGIEKSWKKSAQTIETKWKELETMIDPEKAFGSLGKEFKDVLKRASDGFESLRKSVM